MRHINVITQLIAAISLLGLMFFSNATHAASLSLPAPKHPTEYEKQWGQHLIQDIKADFTNYMKNDNLIILGDSFLIAGILANTGLDRAFAQHWQTDLRSSTSDNLLALPKTLGGLCLYYVPTYLASMGVGHLREHTILGNVLYHWGYRSLRTVIVGGIQQAFLTNLLGSGRPNLNQDSKWQPFKYQTGVSGHAFYGAVPFLTAAMMSDPPLLKYSLYFFSTLPSISRINSNRHYLSQVILGWTLAFLSARSVYATDTERVPPFQVGLQSRSNTTMFTVSLRF